jgi:ABC-type lipoprotein release transport system permease subunit
MLARLTLVFQIAYRNLLASPINLLIGGLIMVGTIIFVILGSLLASLNTSMSKSITGSIAGHVQVYAEKSKEDLALFGGAMGADPDLAAVNNFPKIKETLETVENVETIVPMGLAGALITSGNIVDNTVDKLRDLYKLKNTQSTPEVLAKIESEKSHIRQIIKVLKGDAEKAAKDLMDEKLVDKEAVAALKRVGDDAFWNDFDVDSEKSLEFLETKIASQLSDTAIVFIRYLGTDLDAFQKSFDRMKVVKGTTVPNGQRGFLIADFIHEEQMKMKNARRLDKIRDAVANGRSIEKDDELKRFVKENRTQTRDLVLQLDAINTDKMIGLLQTYLKSDSKDVTELLSSFFDTTDSNVAERSTFFYASMAPMVELYRVKVGDMLTIKAFTKSGFIQNVSVKVYGTFAFTGLEKSPLAGSTSLIDMMSFRDLYGYLTADKAAELKELQKNTGAKAVSRENAEADLFGENSGEMIQEVANGVIDADKEIVKNANGLRQEDLIRRVYTKEELNSGVILNAAIMLKDPNKLAETMKAIEAKAKSADLGVKVVSWQTASGILGQMINIFGLIIFAIVLVIFGIACIIIFISMMMAVIQRTQMFGTMRAIGAQRSMILQMVLLESVILGLVFGALGMILGAGAVTAIGAKGIPAANDILYFFFSGPRLQPSVSFVPLVVALILILVVTVLSTLIPAILATRISPLRAMQSDE